MRELNQKSARALRVIERSSEKAGRRIVCSVVTRPESHDLVVFACESSEPHEGESENSVAQRSRASCFLTLTKTFPL